MILKVLILYAALLVIDAVNTENTSDELTEAGEAKRNPVLQKKVSSSIALPQNQSKTLLEVTDEQNQRKEIIMSQGVQTAFLTEYLTPGKNTNKLHESNNQQSIAKDKKLIDKQRNIPVHQIASSEAKHPPISKGPNTNSTKTDSDISIYVKKDINHQLNEKLSAKKEEEMSPSASIRTERGIYGVGYGDHYDKHGKYDDYGSYAGQGDYGSHSQYGSKGNTGYGYGAQHGNSHGYSKGYSKGYEHKYSHEYGHDQGQKFNTGHGYGENYKGNENYGHNLYGQHRNNHRNFGYRGSRLGHGGQGLGLYGLAGLGGRLQGRFRLLRGGLRGFGNGIIGYSPTGYLRTPLELHYSGNGYGGYGFSGYYPWYNYY